MRYAIRVAMGIALLAATGIALVQTNQEGIRLPTESSPSQQQRSNSGTVVSNAVWAEVLLGLYVSAVVVAKEVETWVSNAGIVRGRNGNGGKRNELP
jgi:hypothetical protein